MTESVEFPLEAQLVDGTVVLVGSIDQTLSGYDIEAPTAPSSSVEDEFTLELQFLAPCRPTASRSASRHVERAAPLRRSQAQVLRAVRRRRPG